MTNPLATVLIETANGPVIINESDYDAKIHKLASPSVSVESTTYNVVKNGKSGRGSKFIVVDGEGNKIDDKEYNTEADAWGSILPPLATPTVE